jgi:CubicO group peptidase (beta-lactamase class C family)
MVAKASGKSYGEFLHQRIFSPLKMNHTIVFQKGKNQVANRAFGHTKENGVLKETDQSPTSATLGDGGIYSNLEDLAKWDDALAKHSLLGEREMQPA